MTTEEFKTWWTDLKVRFPSVRAWIAKNAPQPEDQQAVLRTWREVVGHVPLEAALAVTAKMQCGDLPWLDEHESIDKLPQHVRRLARQIAWEAEGGEEPEPDAYRPPKGSDFPAGRLLRRWLDLTKAGVPRDEAREQALREFPVGSPTREARYDCHLCQDQGRVLVASPTAILMVLDGTFERCHHREAVVRCTCNAGQRLVRKFQGRTLPWETYNAELDFRLVNSLWPDAEIERFRDWALHQREHSAAIRVQSHAGYEPAFADFNRR